MKHRHAARGFCLLVTALCLANATERAPAQASRPVVRPRLTLDVDGVTFDFIRIDPGRFTMGSPHRYVDEYNWTYEMPAHEVTIRRAYYMGVTEVTVEQFRLFVEQTGYVTDAQKQGWAFSPTDMGWRFEYLVDWQWPGYAQTDREPVVCLDWHDAQAFCRWLSEKTGRDIRLPSEAEWEYACRAGTTGEYAGSLDAMGWYAWNSASRTHPVAKKQPNAWGLYDMHGNAWEWVQDLYHRDCADAPTDGSAWLDTTDVDPRGITRGGSFYNPAWLCRSYIRMQTPLGHMVHSNNGFRLVCALKDAADDRHESIAAADAMVPLRMTLPKPVFTTTPQDFRVSRLKPIRREPGPAFLVPAGTRNVALGAPVSASDEEPIIGALTMITDGDKEGADGSFVELGPFVQHVTIDLQSSHEIYAVQVWHYHKQPRVYFDVIVQISNDPDFIENVKTIFNNDMDNSAGLGVGTDMHYVDTHFGEIFDAGGLAGRYVRLYSNGSTSNELNQYTEVEIYGRPTGGSSGLVPLEIKLPRPQFVGLPSNCFRTPDQERVPSGPRPVILVPPGTTNVARGKPVSTSTDNLLKGRPSMIVDGDKEAEDASLVELPPHSQHVTIDLQQPHDVDVVVVWHNHEQPYVYFDVILQISNDPLFRKGVTTIFNNDKDGSTRLGAGRDPHYTETYEGKAMETGRVRGRYVRLYSSGNTSTDTNHYIEVEVYGKPARR